MSSREAARKARGYTLPLCGELKTTGPCQSAGSRISKGGSSSSFSSDISLRTLQVRTLGFGRLRLGHRKLGPRPPWTVPGSALFSTTIARNALLSMGPKADAGVRCPGGCGTFTRYLPGIPLYGAGKTWGGGRAPAILSGLDDGED